MESSRSFKLDPVVDLRSLPKMLAGTDSSWLGDVLSSWKKLAYPANMSTLVEVIPQARTFWRRIVLVALGTWDQEKVQAEKS